MSGNVNKAKQHALNLKEIFKEDFYLEIQPNDIPAQVNVNKTLIRMSNELNIPLVACNDCHYVLKEDAFAHEVMLALQTKRKCQTQNVLSLTEKHFIYDLKKK